MTKNDYKLVKSWLKVAKDCCKYLKLVNVTEIAEIYKVLININIDSSVRCEIYPIVSLMLNMIGWLQKVSKEDIQLVLGVWSS